MMNKKRRLRIAHVLIMALVISYDAFATSEEGHNGISKTSVQETPISHTQMLQQQAAHWSLDISEYQTYLDLINGPLGKWNPTIDPLMALGMFAETRQQEQRYAERYAQQEFELTERVLHFQTAYRTAFNRLYPDVGLLDQRLLAPYSAHQQQETESKLARRLAQRRFVDDDRLLIFVPRSCPACLTTVRQLMALLSGVKNSGVDIYVRDAANDTAVDQWAKAHGIKAKWLNTQNFTLNRDEGLFRRLQSRSSTAHSTTNPIFLRRNNQFFQLKAADLGL